MGIENFAKIAQSGSLFEGPLGHDVGRDDAGGIGVAVVAEVATGVVAETEVASLRRVDLHTTTGAPVVLGSQVLLDVPVKKRWE